MAPVAVEWLAEASPKLQTAMASGGHADGTPRRCARSMLNATPTARGRWEAMVEVCGMIARSGCPNTLCRPPAIGSSVAATSPRRTSRRAS
jgi:hypothetical protein